MKIVPKAGYECTLEKIDHDSNGKPEQKFDAAFKKKQAKVHINFSLELGRLKIK
jgi:hypothetical protein